ncbi:MAG: antibiotic biosynthesis monooxygenase family protein [Actinomycetota bacterium]
MPILSYLRFVLADEADRATFEQDLFDMLRLAMSQPGYRWAEVTRSVTGEAVYVVVSEWDEVEQVRAWEHHPRHEEVIERWEERYREPFVHRRFVPWTRPPNG